jgi:hypothetical protein
MVSFLEQQITLQFLGDTCTLTRGTVSLGYFPTLRWIIVASLHSNEIQESCLTPHMKTQRCFETSGGTHPTRCYTPEYLNI